MAQGVPVLGVCVYPITDYPGWEDGRLCETGLLSSANDVGLRAVNAEMADELRSQVAKMSSFSARHFGQDRRLICNGSEPS
jgi:hypothetical protein